MEPKEGVLICGAGHGGHAISAYLSKIGHPVTLYSTTQSKVDAIKNRNNEISSQGIINGDYRLNKVTNNLEDALSDNKHIFIVTDANAHKYYAKNLANLLTDQNIVLASPGIGGAMDFAHEVRKHNPSEDITVSETDTLMYACKSFEPGNVTVKTEKKEILYTTVPTTGRNIDSFIDSIYPQFKNVVNPLMGLDDSPVFHIVGMINNSQRIINQEDFNFYIDGIDRETARYMEEMDLERMKVAKAVGIEPRSVKEWLNVAYGVKKGHLFDMIQNTSPYQNTPEIPNRSPAPKTLFHRYLIEEIPLRAVPTVSIANVFGIKTPKYEAMIEKASELTGIDFWKIGRTFEDMGVTDKEIKNWKYDYSWRK